MFNSTKIFVIGVVVAIVYFLLKFMEMRFVESDNQKPVKVLIRDSLVVCISSVLAVFILNQFGEMGGGGGGGGGGSGGSGSGNSSIPAVFVDTPGF
jgi:RsiW-degrading membrane proteinase PrsW (M82 family)